MYGQQEHAGSLNVEQCVGEWLLTRLQVLAAHNGFLFIFGKRQILDLSKGATAPATMSI
jgi:hypothetical protein